MSQNLKISLQKHIRRYALLIFVVYLFTAIFLYRPILKSLFVSDDFDWVARAKNTTLVLENLFLRNAEGTRDSGVYRPITVLSFWPNYQASGLNSFGYHLVNVFLHFGSAFLLFWLVWQLTGRNNCWLAFLVGLFFLIFPNHPEAVSWISGRNDVLAVFFFLLSFNLYVLFRIGGRYLWLGVSSLAFALAIFSKEMAASLPIILLAYELVWQKSALWKKKISFILPLATILGLYILLRQFATGLLFSSYSNIQSSFSIFSAINIFIRSLISHFISPAQIWITNGLASHWFLFILLLMCAAWLGWRFCQEKKLYLFSILFFIIALGPVYNLQLSGFTSEGERFVYLPSIGMAMLLAVIVAGLWKKWRILGIITAMVLIVYFSFNLWQRNLIWQNAGALSQQLLADFASETNLKPGEGAVIMGLPDNIGGAYVFRNGWITALKLFYPTYLVDVLPTKALLNLSKNNYNKKVIDWTVLPNGYRASAISSQHLFTGSAKLDSLDYLLNIKNYDTIVKAGNEAEFHFTPIFIAQLSSKTINFLVFNEGRLKKIDPIISVYKENSN
ncbi:MAG: hypothetical protein UU49_C0003G0018 [Candidatus Magasanikbacteria bacterium GW2011_GWC2_41_17]|uniref:Glycosyltransferase RgtA/B/C/D-like domain-containing protein n=2 Tax=Candidatus Magasanikiibacteriota TaxID=1752731 RepID=A0A0G0VFS1_9BACT|nr:MAG: hypothetical protein UU49_C0003G0018 [Candidatus Magasanikbacteria bacterium GW2011_GWC2_41_17]